jgi:DNA polymerase-3 subunit delta
MKIAPKAAESFVAAPQAQAGSCLLYGPDQGLVRERALRIRNAILGDHADPFAWVDLEESLLTADPARLADELSAISLMGGMRLICLRDVGDKSTKIIESALGCFHKDVFLLVQAGDLPSRSSLRALYEKEPRLAALACYKDEARDVAEIVRKALSDAGISLDRDTMDYTVSQLGNDRFVTRQEIEKIITYAGREKTLSLAEMQQLLDYNRDTELDDVVNAIADRHLVAMDAAIANLIREGAQPIAYLRALQRYFNRLYRLRGRMDAGESAESLIKAERPPVFFRQVPFMTRHLNSWNTAQIAKALKLMVEAELACKTSDLPALPASSRKLMQVTQLR